MNQDPKARRLGVGGRGGGGGRVARDLGRRLAKP